jgi:hypothetical protein
MRSLTVLMTLGLLVFLGQQAVTLYKLTVCRQEAWRSAVTLHTRTLLTVVSSSEKDILPQCQILVARKNNLVSWTRMNLPRRLNVSLHLGGKL